MSNPSVSSPDIVEPTTADGECNERESEPSTSRQGERNISTIASITTSRAYTSSINMRACSNTDTRIRAVHGKPISPLGSSTLNQAKLMYFHFSAVCLFTGEMLCVIYQNVGDSVHFTIKFQNGIFS